MAYQHSQPFPLMLIVLPVTALVSTWMVLNSGDPHAQTVAAGLVALDVVLLLGSARLHIECDGLSLRWHYGLFGWPRWHVALADIAAVEKCTMAGACVPGIRKSPEGWAYSAGGAFGVRITLKSGKRLRLGSDDHERLAAFLQARIGRPS